MVSGGRNGGDFGFNFCRYKNISSFTVDDVCYCVSSVLGCIYHFTL